MAQKGTTAGTASQFRAKSTANIKHGPADKNLKNSASRKSVMGSGVSRATTAPLKGPDRGGVC